MSRNYQTTPTMLIDTMAKYTRVSVISPDRKLVETLHHLLDMIQDDNHALMIDHCVAELVRFKNPNRQRMAELELPTTDTNERKGE